MNSESFKFKEHDVFFTYRRAVGNGPTLVFLNGLTDSQHSWAKITEAIPGPVSILTLDLLGQGTTLQKQILKGRSNFSFSVEDQCSVITQLLNRLNIRTQIILVGYSYGGGIAIAWANQNPEQIQKLILLLPFIIRLDQSHPITRLWWNHLGTLKNLPGFFGRQAQMLERVYENFLENYMSMRFTKIAPDPQARRAAVDLSKEIMKLNVFEQVGNLPLHSVYLISSENDALIPHALYTEFWKKLPVQSKQAWIKITNGEHLLLEQAPALVARWIKQIIETPAYEGIQTDAI